MSAPACTDAEFVELWRTHGGSTGVAKALSVSERSVQMRRRRVEKLHNISLAGTKHPARSQYYKHLAPVEHSARRHLDCQNGVVLVFSDAHYWPGEPSVMHKALVRFCKDLKPRIVIMNGDLLDGSTISRHPPINWEKVPKLADEIEAAKERLGEIELATPRNCDLIWCLGNHDARFEIRLATVAPEYAKIHGVHLHDHFPLWRPAWTAWVNDAVTVMHNWKGGVHAPHNNVEKSGKTFVTGHLHSAKVTPYDDYNGRRYGVDTGCIADPYGPQFAYSGDRPRNHRAGFGVFTFRDGRLMYPELVLQWDETSVEFRGQVIKP